MMLHQIFAMVLLLLLPTLLIIQSEGGMIVPGAIWTDSNGSPIQAHGAGFLKDTKTGLFYWYGEDKSENNQRFLNVKVYRSSDLVTWEFVANALTVDENSRASQIGPDSVVERPKVLYNALTERYVMWFHLDNSNYGLAKLGVASSPTIEGPFQFEKSMSPFDEDSRDMTIWKDDDETAYLFYATQVNLNTVIAQLTPDYLGLEPEKVHMFYGVRWEAYAMFKRRGLYYLVTSGTTGWDSNSNHYTYTNSLKNGTWSEAQPIAPQSTNTFNSQSNNVIQVTEDTFIFTGDRWNPSKLGDSRYIWLPIDFHDDNSISISWFQAFWMNVSSGYWEHSNSIILEAEGDAQLSGDAHIVQCSGCTNGLAVGYVGKGGKIALTDLSSVETVRHSIIVGYANGDAGPRRAAVDVNGEFMDFITFPSTGGGQVSQEIVFQVDLVGGGGVNSIVFYNDEEYAPDFDYFRVECYHTACII